MQGAIPASCNIAPDLCVGLYESFQKGDLREAKEFQSRLHPIRMAMILGTGNGAVKEALPFSADRAARTARRSAPWVTRRTQADGDPGKGRIASIVARRPRGGEDTHGRFPV